MKKAPFPVWILIALAVIIFFQVVERESERVEQGGKRERVSDTFSFQWTCKKLVPRIVELKKENPGILNVLIIKMYDIEEIASEGTDRILNCFATALLNNGERTGVNFYIIEDEEGDQFAGYELQG